MNKNSDNKIYFNGIETSIEEINALNKFHIVINGSNNVVSLNDYQGYGKVLVEMNCDNSSFVFGKNNVVHNSLMIFYPVPEGGNLKEVSISIGDGNIFNGNNNIILSPMYSGNEVSIGSYNLWAGNIIIRGRNDHLILDKKTKKIINEERSLYIGDCNWICDNVQIMAKSVITDNNVIALGSLVNKKFKYSIL